MRRRRVTAAVLAGLTAAAAFTGLPGGAEACGCTPMPWKTRIASVSDASAGEDPACWATALVTIRQDLKMDRQGPDYAKVDALVVAMSWGVVKPAQGEAYMKATATEYAARDPARRLAPASLVFAPPSDRFPPRGPGNGGELIGRQAGANGLSVFRYRLGPRSRAVIKATGQYGGVVDVRAPWPKDGGSVWFYAVLAGGVATAEYPSLAANPADNPKVFADCVAKLGVSL